MIEKSLTRPEVKLCGIGGCVKFVVFCHRVRRRIYYNEMVFREPRIHVFPGNSNFALPAAAKKAVEELEGLGEREGTVWLGLIARFECASGLCSIHTYKTTVAQVPRSEIVEALEYLLRRSTC